MTDERTAPVDGLPHLVVPGLPSAERFQRRGGGGTPSQLHTIADRAGHARALRTALEGARLASEPIREQWAEELKAAGMFLQVEGWLGDFELALESLDLRGSGIALVAVQPASIEPPLPERATVFVPYEGLGQFFRRLDEYSAQNTLRGRPRHERLITNIAGLRLAALNHLWTDVAPFPEGDAAMWWELWLRRTGDELETLVRIAELRHWTLSRTALEFPDRTVAAIRATRDDLALALASRLPMAELRAPSLVQSPAQLPREIQRAWVSNLAERIRPAGADAPAVCLLDTGIYEHTLFAGSLDPLDIGFVVGLDGLDRHGHGTELGGLALFGDLTDPLTSAETVVLDHRLESVKILPDPGTPENPPETYGAVTADGVATAEVNRPTRRRVLCMANSTSDWDGDGRPTLWSATVDALSFGSDVVRSERGLELLSDPDPTASRLVVVAGGNVRDRYRTDHLALSDVSPVDDPAQSWNALSVGAYTELDGVPEDPDFAGYRAVASRLDLSPFSRTSLVFGRQWPIKPDVVAEGGNLLVSPGESTFDTHDAVSLPTTSRNEPLGQPLTSTWATSAASAQVAHMAAVAMTRYPTMWPETVRGLIVHSSEWTDPMRAAVRAIKNHGLRQLMVRRYGFGVPTLGRVLESASNSVTLMAQAEILPFESKGPTETTLREMHLHDLPWPREQLLDLGDHLVRLRVTLSYFIEPNPSSRGWRGRYVYPSHGLRFDIRRPGETTGEFRRRLNKLAEEEEGGTQRAAGNEPKWVIGPSYRSRGSLHGDMWFGTAAELADCGVIGVYPVGGWWKNTHRAARTDLSVRYALMVSLRTPDVTVDLYTPIANQIGVPVEITRQ